MVTVGPGTIRVVILQEQKGMNFFEVDSGAYSQVFQLPASLLRSWLNS